MKWDVAILGGGPGGCMAANRCAQAGLSVILFEKGLLGGTCLNRGCIPMKALLRATDLYGELLEGETFGIHPGTGAGYDFSALHRRKAEVVDTLRQGIEKQLKANKVTVIAGEAVLQTPGEIRCSGEVYEAEDVILATGAAPSLPPIPGADLPGVYSSDAFLEGEGLDVDSLVIIGGGVIGAELAGAYLGLGRSVTILELADHMLPNLDREIAQRLTANLKKQGAVIEVKAAVEQISGAPGAMTVSYRSRQGRECTASGQAVLAATGRRAATQGLFGPGVSPELNRGAVVTDALGRTSLPHVYAIGDLRAGNIQLAHVAEAQGTNVAAVLAGGAPPVDETVVPSCVYTNPEIASVGMTEEEAKGAGLSVKTGKALTGANGKCVIEHTPGGYVKVVTDAATGRILGGQLVCPRATDLVAELALAVQTGMTAAQLAGVIHPHPTFSEMVSAAAREAARP